ncbi:MAG: hypothetical protein P1U40_05870 [Coxiellaceae bacterium]|nr:hypothetical protein [Coxiellaceae bacterium]
MDVTANNAQTQQLQQRYGVIAPPTIVFINSQGQVQANKGLVGEINAKDFLTHLTNY